MQLKVRLCDLEVLGSGYWVLDWAIEGHWGRLWGLGVQTRGLGSENEGLG